MLASSALLYSPQLELRTVIRRLCGGQCRSLGCSGMGLCTQRRKSANRDVDARRRESNRWYRALIGAPKIKPFLRERLSGGLADGCASLDIGRVSAVPNEIACPRAI